MRRSSRLVCSVGLALSMFSPALFGAPPVLDRVPSNAIAVVTTPSLAKLHKSANDFLQAVEAPVPIPGLDEIMEQIGIADSKGFDAKSSVALAFIAPATPPAGQAGEDAAEPDPKEMAVAIIQVKNYADFVGNFGVKPGAAGSIDSGMVDGETSYFKDLGDGFAAMAPVKGTIERAEWKAGNGKAHAASIGADGDKLIDSSDLSLVIFTQQAKQYMPDLEDALDDQMEMNPAGDIVGGLKDSPIAKLITDAMKNDSTASITGVRMDAQGVSFDIAMTFKEGSATATKLAGIKGSSQNMLSKLPAQPYFFAMAMDLSSPAARALVDEIVLKDQAPTGISGFLANWAKNSDGAATVMGMPPGGLMAGLFTSTVSYVKTSNPDAFVKNMESALQKLDGQSHEGLKLDTSFVANGSEVEGKKVDTWGIKIGIDEDSDEDPGQMAMALPMIFGQAGGPAGYIARTDGGLVQTFARNQALMNNALKVGNGVDSMTSDKLFAKVAEQLPKDRIVEFYVGVKSLLESAIPLMAMAEMEVDIEIPPSLPPIGMGIAGSDRGMRVGMYMPAMTMKTLVKLGMQMQAAGMGDDDFDDEGGKKNDGGKGTGQPRF